MPTGDAPNLPRRDRGFVYLGLLMLLALLGAALGQAGQVWHTQAQREREAELRFRGEQIRAAIVRYREATRERAWPPSLEALLEDRRDGRVRHHLRRLWTDPYTGAADWVLLPAPVAGRANAASPGIVGVRSRSAADRRSDPGTPPIGARPAVSDWRFEAVATAPTGTPGPTEVPRRSPP